MSGDVPVTTWIGKLRAGDPAAAQKLWEVYFARLLEVARTRLRGTDRRAADEEDVVLSAFHSFCRAAANNHFPRLDSRDDLWQVLVTLTARKAYRERERQHALKRGGIRTPTGSETRSARSFNEADLDEIIGEDPDPAFVALMAERCRDLLKLLPAEDLRQIATLRLEGYANAEIAERLTVSERTIERKLVLIRSLWEEVGPDAVGSGE